MTTHEEVKSQMTDNNTMKSKIAPHNCPAKIDDHFCLHVIVHWLVTPSPFSWQEMYPLSSK